MRLGEIISLRWWAVDLDRGLVTIYDARGGEDPDGLHDPGG